MNSRTAAGRLCWFCSGGHGSGLFPQEFNSQLGVTRGPSCVLSPETLASLAGQRLAGCHLWPPSEGGPITQDDDIEAGDDRFQGHSSLQFMPHVPSQ